jgi:hypothetical protein
LFFFKDSILCAKVSLLLVLTLTAAMLVVFTMFRLSQEAREDLGRCDGPSTGMLLTQRTFLDMLSTHLLLDQQ